MKSVRNKQFMFDRVQDDWWLIPGYACLGCRMCPIIQSNHRPLALVSCKCEDRRINNEAHMCIFVFCISYFCAGFPEQGVKNMTLANTWRDSLDIRSKL